MCGKNVSLSRFSLSSPSMHDPCEIYVEAAMTEHSKNVCKVQGVEFLTCRAQRRFIEYHMLLHFNEHCKHTAAKRAILALHKL